MAIYRGIGGAGDSTTDATITAVTQQAANAAASATSASTSASNASTSATAAASSASAAASSASAASSSATSSANSAAAAAASVDDAAAQVALAAAVYDSFDDRYLGPKTSDPSVDNDGNALLVGALYFNTTASLMKVYTGSEWLTAYASLSGALLASNNLSDLASASTSRTNLGLGTAATTDASAYATAAQGTKADTAYGWGDHSAAGYLTTETDPVYVASSWYTTTNNSANWNTAYGWGNHASAGYLTTETDPIYTASSWYTTTNNASNWDTAYSWGNYSVAIGSTIQAYDADTAKTDVAQTFTAGQRGEITALTDGSTITPNFADSNNFSVTLGGNRTMANPSNLVAGQSGSIFLTQDGTGSRTLAWGSYWDFAGGTAPTLTTTAAAVDRVDYVVRSSTSIHAVFTGDYS